MINGKNSEATSGAAEARPPDARASRTPDGRDGFGTVEIPQVGYKLEMAKRLGRGEDLERVSEDFDIPVHILSDWYDRLKERLSGHGKRLRRARRSFSKEDLGEHDVAYLFVEGISVRLRPDEPRANALAAWGITYEGRMVPLGLARGSRKKHEGVLAFFKDMRSRGLRDPLLVVFGCPGDIVKAVEDCFPRTVRQQCLAHRRGQLNEVLPDETRREFLKRAHDAYRATTPAKSVELADRIVDDFARGLPDAVECFQDDFQACIAYLTLPAAHHGMLFRADLIEKMVKEELRKVGVVPDAFGKNPLPGIALAAMINASEEWKPIKITDAEMEQMRAFRERLDREHEARAESGLPERGPKQGSGDEIGSDHQSVR